MNKSQPASSLTATQTENNDWSLYQKVVFRFVFILFSLFIIFHNNGSFPLFQYVIKYPTELLHLFIPWLAKNFLKLSYNIEVFTNGSGDTTYDYVLLLFISFISVVGCSLWSALDKKKKNYNRLFYWLTVSVRFYLGLMLIQYGMVKVIKLQFPFPNLYRLSSTYGESTPMGLAWTFLGFSTGYNLFMGIAELMGFLLLFRRTVTLGAIIALMTTANVMAVNYFYDVPVKILSTALLLMSIYLLVPNLKRLFSFFISGEAVRLRNIESPVFTKKWMIKAKPVAKILIVFAPTLFTFLMLISQKKYYGSAKKLPLYGIYEVSSFNWEKDTAENTVYALEWKKLMIETEERSSIRFIDGSKDFCKLKIDTVKKEVRLTFDDDVRAIHKFSYNTSYSLSDHENLKLSGILFGNPVIIKFKKQKIPLMETGFNWINEFPNNR